MPGSVSLVLIAATARYYFREVSVNSARHACIISKSELKNLRCEVRMIIVCTVISPKAFRHSSAGITMLCFVLRIWALSMYE